MKNKTLLISLSAIFVSSLVHAQSLNTSDIRGYISGLYIGDEALRQAVSFADEQLLYNPGLSVGGQFADYDVNEDTDRRFEGDLETTSASLAYVHAFDGFNLGIVVTAVDGEADLVGTDLNPNVALSTEGDGFLVTAGAAKEWDRLAMVLKGSFGELSLETDREGGTLPTTKNSEYDVSLLQVELTVLYALIKDEDYSISPFAKIGYAMIENEGFDESNAADRVSFDDFEDDRPYAEVGVSGKLFSFGSFVPFASVSVWQDLGDDEVEQDVEDSVGNPFAFETPDAAQTVIKGALGFGWAVNESWDIDAGAGYFVGDEIDGFNLSLSTTVRF